MPMDWKNLDVTKIAKQAGSKTDDQLAGQLAALTSIRAEDLKKLFPDQGDVAKFVELMQIVKSGETKNKKVNQIFANADKFGSILITLLGKVI